ncbi:hypothetical protein CBL_12402 [Carabus blaptoides fortunei]
MSHEDGMRYTKGYSKDGESFKVQPEYGRRKMLTETKTKSTRNRPLRRWGIGEMSDKTNAGKANAANDVLPCPNERDLAADSTNFTQGRWRWPGSVQDKSPSHLTQVHLSSTLPPELQVYHTDRSVQQEEIKV